jgi:hypothetical protein
MAATCPWLAASKGTNSVNSEPGRRNCIVKVAPSCDLSPGIHPQMGRVPDAFEPVGLGGATGRAAERSPRHAQHSAPLRSRSAAIGVLGGCEIAERAVRPDVVVVRQPSRQRSAGLGERGEQRLVEQLVTKPAVEALDEGVLGRLPGRDVVCRSPLCRCRRRTWRNRAS